MLKLHKNTYFEIYSLSSLDGFCLTDRDSMQNMEGSLTFTHTHYKSAVSWCPLIFFCLLPMGKRDGKYTAAHAIFDRVSTLEHTRTRTYTYSSPSPGGLLANAANLAIAFGPRCCCCWRRRRAPVAAPQRTRWPAPASARRPTGRPHCKSNSTDIASCRTPRRCSAGTSEWRPRWSR